VEAYIHPLKGAMQYKHLRSYAAKLMRSNPNSTVIIKSKVGDNGPVFEMMYVCFHACKILILIISSVAKKM